MLPRNVNAPATVEFEATVSEGQEPYSFDWDFKDGAIEARIVMLIYHIHLPHQGCIM